MNEARTRLDTWLATRHPEHSRSRWQQWIREGHVHVNGKPCKANDRVGSSDEVTFALPAPVSSELVPQAIPLSILHEDEELIVLNKPAGLVVHPAPGHPDGTLVNALLHHDPDLPGIGGERRPGIVHRLDRDTSGVLVVARTAAALEALSAQFKHRETEKTYLAIVRGVPRLQTGTIATRIGRSERDRKRMSVQTRQGREAVSHYQVRETGRDCALLEVRIETGRTHQIRVHLAHLGHPVLGDTLYGRGRVAGVPAERQLLHAARLSLRHPRNGRRMTFEAPLPDDFERALRAMRQPSIR